MTVKAGQKCTAIRRVIVPEATIDAVEAALAARLTRPPPVTRLWSRSVWVRW